MMEGKSLGCVHEDMASELLAYPEAFVVDMGRREVRMRPGSFDEVTERVGTCMAALRESGLVPGWRDELWPATRGFDAEPLFAVERAAVPLLGLRGYGVHCNGLVRRQDGTLALWVARRAKDKATWPGKLDHVVAGGQPLGISPFENVVKECGEEAGIPEELARKVAKAAGLVSYRQELTDRNHIKRDVLFCYDLHLPEDFTPKPVDGEVEGFELWEMADVMSSVAYTDDFKPNVQLVLIDMFVRHGLVTPEQEGYIALAKALKALDCA